MPRGKKINAEYYRGGSFGSLCLLLNEVLVGNKRALN